MENKTHRCPDCGKNLETVQEPPGIVHTCDDCQQPMERIDDA